MLCTEHLQAACCDLVAVAIRSAGWASFKVTGFSMLPAIWPGDVLTVRGLHPDQIQPGQIVLYRRNAELVAHRVIRSPQGADRSIITRGDSVPSLDPAVETGEIIGQVVGISRNGRAVKLHNSLPLRAVAWVLRRSEVCTRLMMRWSALERRLNSTEEATLQQSATSRSCLPQQTKLG
jgi:signal peptidase I